MGMKKSGKRLLKLGQRAARELGKGGKEWVEKVFQTACGVIEEELGRKDKETARKRAAPASRSGGTKSVGQPAPKRKATSGSVTKRADRRSATPRPPKRERGAPANQRPSRQRARGGSSETREPRPADVPEPEAPPAPASAEPEPMNAADAPDMA
jgi:hypothetical protein